MTSNIFLVINFILLIFSGASKAMDHHFYEKYKDLVYMLDHLTIGLHIYYVLCMIVSSCLKNIIVITYEVRRYSHVEYATWTIDGIVINPAHSKIRCVTVFKLSRKHSLQ